MPDPADMKKFRHLRHGDVTRQGKPRLHNVSKDSLEILITLTPVPSFIWNQCLAQATLGTVLEGRVTVTGNEAKLVSMDEEMENDVRRFDQLLKDTNLACTRKFDEALKPNPSDAPLTAELTDQQRRQALEERLRKF